MRKKWTCPERDMGEVLTALATVILPEVLYTEPEVKKTILLRMPGKLACEPKSTCSHILHLVEKALLQ